LSSNPPFTHQRKLLELFRFARHTLLLATRVALVLRASEATAGAAAGATASTAGAAASALRGGLGATELLAAELGELGLDAGNGVAEVRTRSVELTLLDGDVLERRGESGELIARLLELSLERLLQFEVLDLLLLVRYRFFISLRRAMM